MCGAFAGVSKGELEAAYTLGMNRWTAFFRTKEDAAVDSMGNADFDKEAIVGLQLSYEGATDVYRLGKSLQKKGATRNPRSTISPPSSRRSTERSQRVWSSCRM